MAYRVQPSAKAFAAKIPGHLTSLSLSWLNGQFAAAAVQKGEVQRCWEKPEPAGDLSRFPALLREAVRETSFSGSTVSLVLVHPRLSQQLIEAPPAAAAATLKRLLRRLAQQHKTFEGEATWCSQVTVGAHDSRGMLLHLFPKLLVDQLVRACEKAGLHLTAVVPAAAVLHAHFSQLPLGQEEVALLAAETGGTTTVVIGRRDGQILLARSFPMNWQREANNLAVDLNRTVLYVNQQFRVRVNSIWLLGAGAEESLAAIQAPTQVPVRVSPVPYSGLYWVKEAPKLAPEQCPNLISPEQRKEPQRRVMLRVTTLVTLVLLAVAAATAVHLELLIGQQRRALVEAQRRLAEVQNRHQQLAQLRSGLVGKQTVTKLVVDGRIPPVPTWFLGYVSEVLPRELLLTNLNIQREQSQWRVQLAGVLQPTTNPAPATLLSNGVAALRHQLSTGPFHVKLAAETSQKAAATAAAPTPNRSAVLSTFDAWAKRLTASAKAKPEAPSQFAIEGVTK